MVKYDPKVGENINEAMALQERDIAESRAKTLGNVEAAAGACLRISAEFGFLASLLARMIGKSVEEISWEKPEARHE